MAFTLRNEASASYGDQAEIDSLDWQIVTDALHGTAVFTGGNITAQATPDGTVVLDATTYRINSSNKSYAGGNVSVVSGAANGDGSTALAAHATLPRYDLIVVDSANFAGVIHGATTSPVWPDFSVNPVYPAYASTQCVVAAIYIPPATTAITSSAPNLITPKNIVFSVNMLYDQVHTLSGTSHTGTLSVAQGLGKSQQLTGATGATNYAGGTTSGAPLTGTFAVGDFVIDQTAKVWVCTTAGTPGTWGQAGSSMATDVLADAKGDTFAATAADTIARVAVGTPGQVYSGEATNGIYWQNGPQQAFLPTGALAENMPRHMTTGANLAGILTSGRLFLVPIWLPRGMTITSITWVSGGTALVAGTTPHLWAALYSGGLVLRRQSTDDTAPVWAANTAKTFTLSSTYVTTTGGLHYLGVMSGAASGNTVPSLKGMSYSSGTIAALTPLSGESTTALTNLAPDPAAAPGSNGIGLPYVYVS